MVRLLSVGIAICVVAWSAFWLNSSKNHKAFVISRIQQDSSELQWEYNTIDVSGYPFRLDTTISDLSVSNPNREWSTFFSVLHILSLIYEKERMILTAQAPIKFKRNRKKLIINDGMLRASIATDANQQLTELISEGNELIFSINKTDNWKVIGLLLAIKLHGNEHTSKYRYHLKFDKLNFPRELSFLKVTSLPLFLEIKDFVLNADVLLQKSFSSDKFTDLNSSEVKNLKATFTLQEIPFQLEGNLNFSAKNAVNGQFLFSANNWDKVLNLLKGNKMINDKNLKIIASGIILRKLMKEPDEPIFKIPLSIKNNIIFVGPVRLGDIS